MHRRWIEAALLVSLAMTILATTIPAATILAATIAGPASAQQGQKLAQQPSIMQDEQIRARRSVRETFARAASQPAFERSILMRRISSRQVRQPLPDAVAMPSGGQTHARRTWQRRRCRA
jgi:hypothetical protein